MKIKSGKIERIPAQHYSEELWRTIQVMLTLEQT